MTKKLVSVEINATLTGYIWWPQIPATTQKSEKFTPEQRPFTFPWTGLRDAIDHITMSGDFQTAYIRAAWMTVTWTDGKNTITRTVEVLPCKLIADYFTTDPELMIYPEFEEVF